MFPEKPTPLSEIGEFGLIEKLTSGIVPLNKNVIKGIGDDAAVISMGEKCMIVTADILMEGIHFNLIYTPLKHLGYKAVVVNLSDICAMNAVPRQIIVSIAISNKFSVEAVEDRFVKEPLAARRAFALGNQADGGVVVDRLPGQVEVAGDL